MSSKHNSIIWLQNWYKNNCDGEWEHDQNINITTIDNPGWSITIKLDGTDLDRCTYKEEFIENTETDWFCCRVKNNKFLGDGGVLNLLDMIDVFKKWHETNNKIITG